MSSWGPLESPPANLIRVIVLIDITDQAIVAKSTELWSRCSERNFITPVAIWGRFKSKVGVYNAKKKNAHPKAAPSQTLSGGGNPSAGLADSNTQGSSRVLDTKFQGVLCAVVSLHWPRGSKQDTEYPKFIATKYLPAFFDGGPTQFYGRLDWCNFCNDRARFFHTKSNCTVAYEDAYCNQCRTFMEWANIESGI